MGSPFVWTGTNVVKAVRDTIGDPEAQSTRWTTVEIVAYLNRSGQQLALDVEVALETQWDLLLVSGTAEYAMPVNFVSDRRIEYIRAADDIRTLQRLTTQQYEEWKSHDPSITGEPTTYYFWRKLGSDLTSYQPTSIFFQPIPDATANGKTVRVWGSKIPDAISESSLDLVLEVPSTYVEAMVLYASSIARFDDGDPQTGAQFRNLYEAQVLKIKNASTKRSRSSRARLLPRDSIISPSRMAPGWPWARRW